MIPSYLVRRIMQSHASSFINRRSSPRYKTTIRALARVGDNEFSCDVLDISAGGAGVEAPPSIMHLTKMRKWNLEIAGFVSVPALRMWQSGNRVGLRFDISPHRRQTIASQLVTMDRTRDDIWISED